MSVIESQRGVRIQRIDTDPGAAVDALRSQQLGLMVIAPADGVQAIREGRRAQIQVEYNEVDPSISGYPSFIATLISTEINQEILTQAAQTGENWVLQGADPGSQLTIPPDVIAAPTEAAAQNVAPTQPHLIAFFAPAVLALVLQHTAVTLSALSFVREREGGALELCRVSPVTSHGG